MKTYIFKSVLILLSLGLFTSCEKSYDNVATEVPTFTLIPTIAVSTINAAPTTTTTPTIYTADDVIEGYITSSDASGNFFKTLTLQDVQTSSGTPVGFSFVTEQVQLYQKGYFTGRKVYIKLKGLAYAKVFGSLRFGIVDPTDATRIASLPIADFDKHLFASPIVVDESTLVRNMSLLMAAADVNQNTLIEITNVQFSDNSLGKTLFDASLNSLGLGTNHDIVDYTLGGRGRFCRISKFAPFSVNKAPIGRGSIRGVMSKFNSDFQFTVRNEADFKLNLPRVYSFFSSLNENFISYPATGSFSLLTSYVNFPNYINFITSGTKKWFVKTGGFLEISAFGGSVENNKAYFMVPVNMTAANTFKFDIAVGFFTNKLGLKVYRTTNYVPGMNINDATLFDITTSFTLPSATSGFTSSGTYNIPATVVGNGYFVFEYTGTNISTGPPVTTTIQLDNIIVN